VKEQHLIQFDGPKNVSKNWAQCMQMSRVEGLSRNSTHNNTMNREEFMRLGLGLGFVVRIEERRNFLSTVDDCVYLPVLEI